MKNIDKLKLTLKGFTSTINRYPITILLFLFSAIFTSYHISTNNLNNIGEILLSLAFGAALFMVLQTVFERFCHGKKTRLIFTGLAALGAILYYLTVEFLVKNFSSEHAIKTMVFLFILLISFMWIPSIKSRFRFSESFMIIFKAFFIVALYSGVLYLGVALIIMAIDMLIVNVDSDAYAHLGNIVVYIYAPIHFLSLIPIYPRSSDNIGSEAEGSSGNQAEDELTQRLNKAIEPSKFLGGLVSYIIIPITAIFTVILLLYVIMNITGDFWKDNLMEPLLVTFSITVIVVYLLASVIRSKPAVYFIKIFPKVMIPVVLFQTISSSLKIGELGITSGRYYVIMFGIFATVSAFIFSIRPNHKNNVIAPILIALSLISILPPTDAFTISKYNQINRLSNVLEKNEMLKDDKIVPNANIADEDKQIIINSVRYLSRMDYLKDINWLHDYYENYDFQKTFGFNQFGNIPETEMPDSWRLFLAQWTPIDISDYDIFVEADLYRVDQRSSSEITYLEYDGYSIKQEGENGIGDIVLRDGQDNELIRYSLDSIFERFMDREPRFGDISRDEAEFISENDNVVLYIVVKTLSYEIWDTSEYQNINAYIMVKIK
jgi:hypothetical protein